MAYVTTDRSGVPFNSSSAPAVIGPSGGYSSGGSSSNIGSQLASDVGSIIQTTDGPYQEAIRDAYQYSAQNSAFNAEQAAEQREWSADQARIAMAASAEEAQKNREWQEMMSNTAHQRAAKDLIAAGLNPVLAAGVAASTPSGSAGTGYMPSGSSASSDNSSAAIGSIMSTMISTAAQASLAKQNYEYNSDLLNRENAVKILQSENAIRQSEISAGAMIASSARSAEAQEKGQILSYHNSQEQREHDKRMAALEYMYNSMLQENKEEHADNRNPYSILVNLGNALDNGLTKEILNNPGSVTLEQLARFFSPAYEKDGIPKK